MKKVLVLLSSLILGFVAIAQENVDSVRLKAESDSLYNIGVELYNAKMYEEAILFFKGCIKADTVLYAEDDIRSDYAKEWLASCYYKLGDTITAAKTGRYYFKEPLDRRANELIAFDSLISKGLEFETLGDVEAALETYLKAEQIAKDYFGEEHYKVAIALNNASIMYYYLYDIQNSLKLALKAHEITKKDLGDYHGDNIANLNSIAAFYSQTGEYKKALKYFLELKDIGKIVWGENSLEYNTILDNLGTTYCMYGDLYNAIKIHQEVVRNIENIDENSTEYALALSNLASDYVGIGDFNMALRYKLSVKYILERRLGAEHPTVIDLLSDIGSIYRGLGNYIEARKYYDQIIDISNTIGRELSAEANNNIGIFYSSLGNSKKSIEYYLLALDKAKKTDGEQSPSYIVALADLGSAIKDSTKAFQYLQKAAEISKDIYGENSVNYAQIIRKIGLKYGDYKDYSNALKYSNFSLDIYANAYGKTIDYYLTLAHIAANYAFLENKQDTAVYLYKKSLEGITNFYPKTHSHYIDICANLGGVYYATKNYKSSVKYLSEAIKLSKQNLITNFSFLTAYEREQYWNENQEFFMPILLYCNKLPTDTTATKASYNAELITKGLLLTSEIEFSKIIMESGDSALLQDFENMKLLRLQLDKQYEKPISERTLNCDSLENIADKLEKKLIENCKEYGDFTKSIALEWTDVQNALAKNDLAIEFTSFKIAYNNDMTMYAALVLDKNMEAPQMIPLFTNFELDKAMQNPSIEKTKEEIPEDERGAIMMSMKSKSKGIYETSALYNLIWKPLENHLNNSERVFFAPSGKLYQIAIEYLPIDESTNISDKYELYRVSSTKNLAMDYVPKPYQSSTLYGGINYDTDSVQMKEASERYSTRLAERGNSRSAYTITDSTRSVRNSLAYLPGTKAEVQTIQKQLAKKKIGVSLYEGNLGNEESFKALSGTKNEILHVATHGFFLEEDEENKTTNSLDRAGLLLSGANLAWTEQPLPEGVEDGILTAREISYLDFRGVDLLVLSACQTALGEVTGEGVFGLQRGFKKAGVKSIVMSLWSVDDAATQLMMTEFYKNLTKGKTKRESFLAAQKTVKTTKGFEKPYYWAAFVLLDGE